MIFFRHKINQRVVVQSDHSFLTRKTKRPRSGPRQRGWRPSRSSTQWPWASAPPCRGKRSRGSPSRPWECEVLVTTCLVAVYVKKCYEMKWRKGERGEERGWENEEDGKLWRGMEETEERKMWVLSVQKQKRTREVRSGQPRVYKGQPKKNRYREKKCGVTTKVGKMVRKKNGFAFIFFFHILLNTFEIQFLGFQSKVKKKQKSHPILPTKLEKETVFFFIYSFGFVLFKSNSNKPTTPIESVRRATFSHFCRPKYFRCLWTT